MAKQKTIIEAENGCHIVFQSSDMNAELQACRISETNKKINFFYHKREEDKKKVSSISQKSGDAKTLILKLSEGQVEMQTHRAEDFWDFKDKSLEGMCEFDTVNKKFLALFCTRQSGSKGQIPLGRSI